MDSNHSIKGQALVETLILFLFFAGLSVLASYKVQEIQKNAKSYYISKPQYQNTPKDK
ncbi:MAG TPA: hypothetical protein PLJ21_01990 [Pseudobdellovibrionaceae bacterium]|nr:hypothetical protein [Pseudobdellovibrionaceae bacterium]